VRAARVYFYRFKFHKMFDTLVSIDWRSTIVSIKCPGFPVPVSMSILQTRTLLDMLVDVLRNALNHIPRLVRPYPHRARLGLLDDALDRVQTQV